MPQFDPAPYIGQLFWLAVCFIILNVVMIRWLLPRLQQSIALREKRIQAHQQETQRLLGLTAALNNEVEERLSAAQHQSLALIQQGLQDVETLHKESLAHYDHQLEQQFMSYENVLNDRVQTVRKELGVTAEQCAEQLTEKYFMRAGIQ